MDPAEHPRAAQKFLALGGFADVRASHSARPRAAISRSIPVRSDSIMRGTAISAVARSRLIARMISAWICRRFEHYGGSQQRRHQQSHELAEYVAQRHEGHKTQRMKPPLIFSVRSNSRFQRLEIRQKISVGQHHSPRLGGGARSK